MWRSPSRRGIQATYPGNVSNIVRMRPGTSIDDEEIPALLRTVREPTFITINVADFWRRIRADLRFGIICFAIPAERLNEISPLVRRLGKIARVSTEQILYYTAASGNIQFVNWNPRNPSYS